MRWEVQAFWQMVEECEGLIVFRMGVVLCVTMRSHWPPIYTNLCLLQ